MFESYSPVNPIPVETEQYLVSKLKEIVPIKAELYVDQQVTVPTYIMWD